MPFFGYRMTSLPKPRVLIAPIKTEFETWHQKQFSRKMKPDDWDRKPGAPLEQGGFNLGELQWTQLLIHIIGDLHNYPDLKKYYAAVRIESGIDKKTYQAPLSVTPVMMVSIISDAFEHAGEAPIS